MQKRNLIAAGTVALAGLAAAPALGAANGPQIIIQIEGLTKTLVPQETVITPGSGSITKDGIRAGACPADSAQGALNTATAGHWAGKWYAEYSEYEITSIAGETLNPNRDYYEIFVNNVAASAGACDIKLKPGDRLLFAAVPDTGKPETPIGLKATIAGTKLDVAVEAFNAKGKPSLLKGAKVTDGASTATTLANGTAVLSLPTSGQKVNVVATATGHIRAEVTLVRGR